MTSIRVCQNRSRSQSTTEVPNDDEHRASIDSLRRSTTTANNIDPATNAKYCSFYRRLSREVNEKIQESLRCDDGSDRQAKEEPKAISPDVLKGPEMLDFQRFGKEDFGRFEVSKRVYKGAEVVTKQWS